MTATAGFSQSLSIRALLAQARSDGWLMGRSREHDPAAQAAVCRRYHRKVYERCRAELGDEALAERASDDALARFLAAQPSGAQGLPASLFALAEDACERHGGAEPPVVPEEGPPPAGRAHERGAEADWRQRQERAAARALAAMRPRERSALILGDLFGFSDKETAEYTSTSQRSAIRSTTAARKSFARRYARERALPPACTLAVELICERESGGLSKDLSARLDAHAAACPACGRETQWADKSSFLGAALPLTASVGSYVERGRLPQLVLALGSVFTSNPHRAVPVTKRYEARVAAGTLALAAALVFPAAAIMAGGTGMVPRPARVGPEVPPAQAPAFGTQPAGDATRAAETSSTESSKTASGKAAAASAGTNSDTAEQDRTAIVSSRARATRTGRARTMSSRRGSAPEGGGGSKGLQPRPKPDESAPSTPSESVDPTDPGTGGGGGGSNPETQPPVSDDQSDPGVQSQGNDKGRPDKPDKPDREDKKGGGKED